MRSFQILYIFVLRAGKVTIFVVKMVTFSWPNTKTSTAKNKLITSLLTSCNNLLQQADIRMRLHGLRQLVDNKSVASCQQACFKLIISRGMLQVVLISRNKFANDKLQQS